VRGGFRKEREKNGTLFSPMSTCELMDGNVEKALLANQEKGGGQVLFSPHTGQGRLGKGGGLIPW